MASHTPKALSLLIACLIISVSILSTSSSARILQLPGSKSEKVRLELFYESLCGPCAYFLIHSLNDLVHDPELLSILDLHLYPWGNAMLTGNDTFACQHGPEECMLNTVEACTIHAFPKVEDHFPLIFCIESLHFEPDGKGRSWESCFEKSGLDPKPISDCYNGGLGQKLELEYGRTTLSLDPHVQYVPWVVVDGEHIRDKENVVSYICKAYKGSFVPKACKNLPDEQDTERNLRVLEPQVCYKETTLVERITTSAAALEM